MEDVVLSLHSICKSFFGVPAVSNVSLQVQRGKVLGLIGENGAGKSTLMNIIGGIIAPDSGVMHLQGRPYIPKTPRDAAKSGIAFIHQELNLFLNLSVAENVFLESFPLIGPLPLIHRKRLRDLTHQLLKKTGLEVSPDTLVEKLSPGERQLVEITKALSFDPVVVIFDEPTTSLTSREKERLFDLILGLRDAGKAIIYISHILQEVDRLHDSVAVLRDGLMAGGGNRGELSIEDMIALMVGSDIKQMYPARRNSPGSRFVMRVKGLCRSRTLHDIGLDLREGEIVGLFGLMGSGRTELARILYGVDRFDRGTIEINGSKLSRLTPSRSIRRGVAFITEDRRGEGLMMNCSVSENVELVALPKFSAPPLGFIRKRAIRSRVEALIKELRVRISGKLSKCLAKSLSGGNQQKVVIAKWLMSEPTIVIADEPTRGIDVGAKREVYSILTDLADRGNAVLFISSEIEELIGICDRIIVMNRGEVLCDFPKSNFEQEKILAAAFRAGRSSEGRPGV